MDIAFFSLEFYNKFIIFMLFAEVKDDDCPSFIIIHKLFITTKLFTLNWLPSVACEGTNYESLTAIAVSPVNKKESAT